MMPINPADYLTGLIDYAWSFAPDYTIDGVAFFIAGWLLQICMVVGIYTTVRCLWHLLIYLSTGRQTTIKTLKTTCRLGFSSGHLEIYLIDRPNVRVDSSRDENNTRIIVQD